MTPWINVLATITDNLSSIPGIHTVRELIPARYPLTSVYNK